MTRFKNLRYRLMFGAACALCLCTVLLEAGPARAQSVASPDMEAQRVALIQSVQTRIVTIKSKERRHDPFCELVQKNKVSRQTPACDERERDGDLRDMVGSGVVYRGAQGVIVTAAHLTGEAENLQVVLPGGGVAPATVIGKDERTGIAVLKTAPIPVADLRWANSSPQVGASVLAIGQAYSLGVVASAGIVTGVHDLDGKPRAVMVDAQMHKGMSGGAFINSQGEVMAVGFAIYGARMDQGTTAFGVGVDATLVVPAVERILAAAAGR